MDLAPIYLQRLGVTADLVRNIKPDQLALDTPCAEFNLRQLANHFIGGTLGLAKGAAGEMEVDPNAEIPDLIGQAGDDPAAAMDPVLKEAQDIWSRPGASDVKMGGGPPIVRIALIEAVLHGWDIAKATGQPYEIPDMIAQPILAGLQKVMTGPRDKGGFFGPEVKVPDDAPIADQLVAFTGRTP